MPVALLRLSESRFLLRALLVSVVLFDFLLSLDAGVALVGVDAGFFVEEDDEMGALMGTPLALCCFAGVFTSPSSASRRLSNSHDEHVFGRTVAVASGTGRSQVKQFI